MSCIKHSLPIPTHCDNCCSVNVQFVNNEIVYGKSVGSWPYAYYCADCRASVGCHPKTKIPLGRLADWATRQLRSRAHNEFDLLWRNGYMSRDKAYKWLAQALEIDVTQCHLSQLSKDQLKDTITLTSTYIKNNIRSLEKRRIKYHERQRKSTEREQRRIVRGKRAGKFKAGEY